MTSRKILTQTVKTGLFTSCLLMAATAQQTLAHGYAEFPKARQAYCEEDGGYWWPADGSGIPNAACRAAFLEAGTYQFVQAIEFSKNVTNYNSQAAVEAGVPNGTLCAAGDSAKSGIDIPHPDWPAQQITLNGAGEFEYLFYASTPHDPSFWKFYLSKPGFNPATDVLTWGDLELVDEKSSASLQTINGKRFYVMNVSLPTNRSGDAILYTRWQRQDVAGEGFYNCSDIVLGDVEPPTWNDAGAYVQQGINPSAGDQIWFRVFDNFGSEVVFNQFDITAANEALGSWTAELANEINNTETAVRVGVLSGGNVSYNSGDLYANRVYVLNDSYTYQMDLETASSSSSSSSSSSVSSSSSSSSSSTDGGLCSSTPEWTASAVYTAGDQAKFNNALYEAQWWTQNQNPADNAGQWQVWQKVGDC
ncbi:lytic polysaccharide monooxygenase [Gilvimarinus algae]|uniref:Lytic polysaccharide monooxygenase n=1 Tax=Gilvimarinus algae TaxID=3058037 RepID=A0ABT8TBI1_9GAMM|nr:lytic polysaccharide monooxygenase [Gilvimarinus sp. SDUM040014]MDO3381472.1 lytic polysaccharide monooxygenase [Gilvimarinus sp. SDUM040014]